MLCAVFCVENFFARCTNPEMVCANDDFVSKLTNKSKRHEERNGRILRYCVWFRINGGVIKIRLQLDGCFQRMQPGTVWNYFKFTVFFFFRIWKTSGWFHTRLSISNYSCDRYLCQQKTWIDYNLFVISTQSSIVMYA